MAFDAAETEDRRIKLAARYAGRAGTYKASRGLPTRVRVCSAKRECGRLRLQVEPEADGAWSRWVNAESVELDNAGEGQS